MRVSISVIDFSLGIASLVQYGIARPRSTPIELSSIIA